MVEYDSTIPPGRTGKVTQEVNLRGIHGPFRKDIVVVSNAADQPSLRLYLKGTIRAVIDVEPRYLRLPIKQGKAAEATITLKTEKADLTVSSISFESSGGSSAAQGSVSGPVQIRHTLKREERKDAEGQYRYTLEMTVDCSVKESMIGAFSLQTNHEEKPAIEIRGMILSE